VEKGGRGIVSTQPAEKKEGAPLKVRPLGDRVVVKVLEQEERT
jgi:hypothetical protein